jgi:transcriptional regulator with XRE-family HTH domain
MKKKRPVSSDIRARFGNRLKQLRTEKGLSQERLAELATMHWTYVGGIERGERNPTLINIEKLADALEVSLPVLLTLEAKRD